MRNSKLLKSILIPTLGISAIGSIAVVSTNCEEKKSAVVPVTSVSLNKTSTTLTVGDTETLTAAVLPETATDKSVNWTSSNPSIATVDSNGTITAVSEGTATITVKTNDGGKTATCEVTVNDVVIHVESVELNKSETTLAVGETETLTATVLPEDAADKSVNWASSNPSVATVDSNGKITAKELGETTITATSVDNPSAQCTCNVWVLDAFDDCVSITANEDSTFNLANNGGNNPNLRYSYNCLEWNTYNDQLSIPAGQTLYLKGDNSSGWSNNYCNYSTLSITGDVSLNGSIMGLLDNGEGIATTIPCDYCFYSLFSNSTGITSVSENFLPATTLANSCYVNMFSGCTSLQTAPALPATTLAPYCYWNMFFLCTSLQTAPALPATTLAPYCYQAMFFDCSSLNSIKISYTGNYDSNYFEDWVNGVASSGTFYYNGSQTPQDFQLPSDWITEQF